jgi:N-acetylglucosamine-6-phosphate deacetylase
VTQVLAAPRVDLCDDGRPLPAGWLAHADGVITDCGAGDPPAGAVDLGDVVLAAGYVDLQVNGIAGDDLGTADPDGWARVGRTLLGHGVTAYCPTFVTSALDEYEPTVERAAAAQAAAAGAEDQAQILGVHLEGPFLGGAPGAHRVELIRAADTDWMAGLLAAHPGLVRIVTLAPEADPGFALTRLLSDAGVTVALGHTTATYADARAASSAGASVVTHLFNGMRPLHHREPGVAGAALEGSGLTPTVIADLVHVHPMMLELARTARDVAIVSDVVALDGEVTEHEGAARLPNGRLAGATTLLDEGVANAVHSSGWELVDAVRAASYVPASLVGADADRGRLTPGARADLLALDPVTLAVRAVWLTGDQVVGT